MQTLNVIPKTIAKPANDGQDSLVYIEALEYSPIEKVEPICNGEAACFEGGVALRHRYPVGSGCQFAPFDHPNIGKATALLKKVWPAAYHQFDTLIHEFQPMYLPNNTKDGRFGSMSHQPPGTFGSVWATVNDPICLAQAFVHEMAHNKLFALGLQFEDPAPLFANAPEDLFDSPIRLDIPRPIGAVFHGVYAFTHVLQLDLNLLNSGELDEEAVSYVQSLLVKNLNRVRIGLEIVEKCALLTDEGRDFVRGAFDWARQCIADGEKAMPRNLVDRTWLIIGPTCAGKSTFCAAIAQRTGKKRISLDLYCWDFWYQLPVVQDILRQLFGESKRDQLNQVLTTRQRTDLLRKLTIKRIITPQVRDHLVLQLLKYVIKKYPGALIDTGSGHCVFSEDRTLKRFKQALIESNIPVIQVRPVAESGETLRILTERIKARNSDETEIQAVERNLRNPSYRTLNDYLLDSTAPTEELVERALGLLGGTINS